MERNSIFHQLNKVVLIIKSDAAFIEKVGTKNDVVTKTVGINN